MLASEVDSVRNAAGEQPPSAAPARRESQSAFRDARQACTKAVPTSIAASAMNARASANTPTSAMASAPSQRKVGRHRRHDAACQHHRAEDYVGSEAEQRAGVLGDDRFLQNSLCRVRYGSNNGERSCSAARRGTGLTSRSAAVRRARPGQWPAAGRCAVEAHRNTSTSITRRVTKLYIRYVEIRPCCSRPTTRDVPR